MNIKILPSSPLNPLNELFPQGVPVLDGVELSVQGEDAYVFDPKGLSKAIMQQIVNIAMADKMPATITLIFMSERELIIPKEWVCTQTLTH